MMPLLPSLLVVVGDRREWAVGRTGATVAMAASGRPCGAVADTTVGGSASGSRPGDGLLARPHRQPPQGNGTTKGDAWQTYRPSLATFHQPVLH